MRNVKSYRPVLEALEARWVPAVLLQLDINGNLTGIFGVPAGNVDVVFNLDNEVNVSEDGNDLGTYEVGGNLLIELGNTVEALTHTVDFAGNAMDGSLTVRLGNSSDVTTLNILGGTIEGELRVRTGNGEDIVAVTDMVVAGSAFFNTQGSDDALTIDPTTIEGNLSVTGVQDFDLVGSEVQGNFTFNSRTESLAVTLDIDADSSILGIASVSTGGGADVVNLDGTVNSHAIFNLAAGNDVLNVNDGATVLGTLVATMAAGDDDVNLGAATIGGSVTITTAGGDDDVVIDGTTVLGPTITYVAGNGNDDLTITAAGLNAPGARLMFQGQNGNDNVTFADATAIDLLFAFLDGGFGTNDFTSTGVIAFPIVIRRMI